MMIMKKTRLVAVFAAISSFACATAQQGTLVNVTVPPSVDLKALSGEINTLNVRDMTGDARCATPLKTRLEAIITNSGIFKKEIAGFEEAGGNAADIVAKVERCGIDMGHGAISAAFTVVYNGQAWRSFAITKDTNRPGASEAEVLEVLVDRVSKAAAGMFIPLTRQELRVFKPMEKDDPGLSAAMNSNWDLAIQTWTKRLQQTPDDHRVLHNRGVAWEARGDLKRAVKDYRKAAGLERDELYQQSLSRAENALKAAEQAGQMKEQ